MSIVEERREKKEGSNELAGFQHWPIRDNISATREEQIHVTRPHLDQMATPNGMTKWSGSILPDSAHQLPLRIDVYLGCMNPLDGIQLDA